MVHSQATTVELYLSEAPPVFAAPLERMRLMARTILVDHEERMHWGMPSYLRAGKVRFGFAVRKAYLSLYFPDAAPLHRRAASVAHLNPGKNCIRITRPAAIDWRLIEDLLLDAAAVTPCPIGST